MFITFTVQNIRSTCHFAEEYIRPAVRQFDKPGLKLFEYSVVWISEDHFSSVLSKSL